MKSSWPVKTITIDRRNDVVLRVVRWESDFGLRYGASLEVRHTDPFLETGMGPCDGWTSAKQAETFAREYYAAFRPGDELCRGVIKV